MSTAQTRLEVRAVPGAPRSQVVGSIEGVWRIKVAAPPVEGKANEELVSFVAGVLGLSRRQVSIVSGRTSRRKVLSVAALSPEDAAARLLEASRQ